MAQRARSSETVVSGGRPTEDGRRASRHLTVAQAASDLAGFRKFVYEAIWSGALPSLKVGRSIRIDLRDWERFLSSLRE